MNNLKYYKPDTYIKQNSDQIIGLCQMMQKALPSSKCNHFLDVLGSFACNNIMNKQTQKQGK